MGSISLNTTNMEAVVEKHTKALNGGVFEEIKLT
jgi:hypothetical protein